MLMRIVLFRNRRVVSASVVTLAVLGVEPAAGQWRQWGGPNRDFKVEASGLADEWPETGPARLWRRELGDGYSSIVVDDGMLYTMHRRGTDEFTVALDAQTGRTVWEHANPAPRRTGTEGDRVAPGPNSTPLVRGDRLYSIGTLSVIHCFRKKSGEVLWKRDLIAELGGRRYPWGYAASPIAYKNLIITTVGREHDESRDTGPTGAPTLVALDQENGHIIWKSQDYAIRHSSPILIRFGGQDQIVLLLQQGVIGVNPDDGTLLWQHGVSDAHFWDMTPLWVEGNVLIGASGEETRAIRLTKEGEKTVASELWSSRKLRFPQNNPVVVDGYLYGSSGTVYQRSSLLCADVKTGKRAWAKRGFALSTCVYADGKLIILDENGQLGLATAAPEGLTVHSTCRVAERESWTAPTLVGSTLYVRDRRHIMALDLG
jgi:outer membrane protein assembly factor BamB